ncbi:hypothetical protein LXL04_026041 [Taraxacum kok-saghyz]
MYAMSKWKKHGIEEVMVNDDGFYFFRFSTEQVMIEVLEGGPWIIFDNPIVIRSGSSHIAWEFGKPLEVDSWTSNMCNDHWGRPAFMRILMEMSAEKEWRIDMVDEIIKATVKSPIDEDGFQKVERRNNNNNSRIDKREIRQNNQNQRQGQNGNLVKNNRTQSNTGGVGNSRYEHGQSSGSKQVKQGQNGNKGAEVYVERKENNGKQNNTGKDLPKNGNNKGGVLIGNDGNIASNKVVKQAYVPKKIENFKVSSNFDKAPFSSKPPDQTHVKTANRFEALISEEDDEDNDLVDEEILMDQNVGNIGKEGNHGIDSMDTNEAPISK